MEYTIQECEIFSLEFTYSIVDWNFYWFCHFANLKELAKTLDNYILFFNFRHQNTIDSVLRQCLSNIRFLSQQCVRQSDDYIKNTPRRLLY